MAKLARLNDSFSGYCVADNEHGQQTGVIISCSEDVFGNSLGFARLGDQVRANCGHIGTIITSSNSVFANSIGVARLGDSVGGDLSGSIVSGSDDILVGD